jgi:hypothetical protein
MLAPAGGGVPPDADAVRVAVRARPLLPSERAARAKQAVFVAADGKTVLVGQERSFPFDAAFGLHATQAGIYDNVVAPLMDSCFDGARRHAAPTRRRLAHGCATLRGGGLFAATCESDNRCRGRHQRHGVLLRPDGRRQDVHDGHGGARARARCSRGSTSAAQRSALPCYVACAVPRDTPRSASHAGVRGAHGG